jgi:hypothetical protein
MRRSLLAISLLTLGWPGLASAQSRLLQPTTAWGRAGYFGFNGIFQPESRTFDAVTRPEINLEPGEVRTTHEVGSAPLVDVMAGGRIKGNFGFGFGFTWMRKNNPASVQAQVPHPFYFDRFRSVTGDVGGVRHDERVWHAHAMWLVPFTRDVQMSVYGGPSYFMVRQTMVRTVNVADAYPFDTATFTGVETVEQKDNKIGFNVGADLTVFFSKYVGVGGVVRFSRADVDVTAPDGTSEVSIEAGGLHLGGGLRVRF